MPSTVGNGTATKPRRIFQSTGLTAAALTAIRTSLSLGVGRGASSILKTCAPPVVCTTGGAHEGARGICHAAASSGVSARTIPRNAAWA